MWVFGVCRTVRLILCRGEGRRKEVRLLSVRTCMHAGGARGMDICAPPVLMLCNLYACTCPVCQWERDRGASVVVAPLTL